MRLLYKKSGFTLIELIVVIAILAVLAAILVPTMLGMVTKAKVTSMNSTAASIQRNMDLLLLQADPTHYGIINGKDMILDITVKKDGDKHVWTCSPAQEGSYTENNSGKYTWGKGGTYTTDQSLANVKQGEAIICASLCEKTGITQGAMVLVLHSGKCSFVAYTDETTDPIPEDEYPAAVNGSPASVFSWNGQTAGVSPSGWVIGTAPAIPIGQ